MKRFSRRTAWLACPFLLGFALFYVLPFGRVIYYALTRSAMDSRFAGLQNFVDTLKNPYFQLAARNTLRFLAGDVPLLTALSFALSLLLYTAVRREDSPLHSAFILPMLLPSAAIVGVVRLFFSDAAGWAQALGLGAEARALLSVYLLFVWKNTGFQLILDLAALRGVPADMLEAAALDGANALQRFLHMTLPWVAPTVGVGAVFGASQALKIYREAYLLYGEYPPNSVYLLQHYMNNHFYKLNYQRIASASLLLLGALLGAALLGEVVVRRRRRGLA